ncbi:MAG TPA: hypothetical protein PKD55_06885 [Bellilinea sp.]|nr:hypothetical protein [Bellilinea sp.]
MADIWTCWRNPGLYLERMIEVALHLDDPDVVDRYAPLSVALHVTAFPARWSHLDLAHVETAYRLPALAHLWQGRQHLTQERLNFLTLLDEPGAHFGVRDRQLTQPGEEITPGELLQRLYREYAIDAEARALALAFARQMIDQAEPHRAGVVLGEYVLRHAPLAFLDDIVPHDHLRLSFQPDGLFASAVDASRYVPIWWSPDLPFERQPVVALGAKPGLALHILCASIWRDACVVREEFVTERRRESHKPRKKSKPRKGLLVLPRVIRHVDWAQPGEREHIARSAHGVRAHYRHLADGWQTSAAAAENAELYGYAAPPPGYTFVAPHTRGGHGTTIASAPRPIVCKGLLAAKTAFDILASA